MCKSVVFNNEIYVLMKYYDINGIKNNLAICKLNKESIELQFLKEIMPRHNNKKDRVQKLDASLSISSNSENLLVYYGSYNEDTDKVTYQVHVFDTQLNLTLDKTIHKTLKDISLFGRRELFINNEGTAYFSGYDYDQLEKPYKTYFIAALKKNKENIENVIIKKENRYINDLSFGLDAKDNIIYTGFSSERSGEKKIGALYTILSKDLKTEISNDWKPFNIDLTTISVPEKYHQSFIDSVELRMKGFGNKFLVNPNNGMFCIWENTHYHRTIFSGYNYSNSNFKNFYNTRDNYRHSEKLILSVSNEGKINWIKDVRKRQQTSSLSFSWDYHSSYSAFVKNNELYLFYNDNPFNFNKKNFFDFRIMKNFKTAALIMTKINEEGVLKNHLLFNSKDNKTYPSPNIFTRISNNEIILLNQKPYAPNIGKLTLK